MSVRLGLLGVAHMHATSYAHCLTQNPRASYVGLWDADAARASEFQKSYGGEVFESAEAMFPQVDAVGIASENVHHHDLALRAIQAGKHVICEKPLATTTAHAREMVDAARDAGVVFMTAFPCPFSPAFEKLVGRVQRGEIGKVVAVCATNRGRCPGGWFIQKELSGGGAMIDHTVHVADLLYRLLGAEPERVTAATGNNIHGGNWEDTAMVTLEYPGGVFATLDSSWSRPAHYRTWGDVTMNIVGEKGVIEMDMFGPSVEVYTSGHASHGYGSNLDALMFDEFVAAILDQRAPKVTGEDGLRAVRVAEMAYASLG